MGQRYTEWHLDRIAEATAELRRVEAEFNERKAAYLSEMLGFKIDLCTKCSRPMLPRRLWDQTPGSLRRLNFTRRHNSTTCFTHYVNKWRKKQRAPMERDELIKLREKIGFNPDKDYDAEDEAESA